MRIEQVFGQNYLNIKIDRNAIARHGINVSDVNDMVETAIGGKEASTVFEGERKFPLVLRYHASCRENIKTIENLTLRSPNGALVLMINLATISIIDGPSEISRESGKRRLVISVNTNSRDLSGFVKEAQEKIAKEVLLPNGHTLDWGGQFENM